MLFSNHYDQTQYPLQNALALTVHKTQSLSLNDITLVTLPLETQLWRYLRHGSEEHLAIYELNLLFKKNTVHSSGAAGFVSG